MRRRDVLAVLLSGLLTTSLLAAADPQGNSPPPRPSSLQKSLIVPGWGQLAEKRYFEGAFFLTLELCYVYEILKHNHQGNTYYRLYKSAGSAEDAIRYRALTEDSDKWRNIFMIVAGGVWTANLIDTYWIVKRHGKVKSRLEVSAHAAANPGLSVRVRLNF